MKFSSHAALAAVVAMLCTLTFTPSASAAAAPVQPVADCTGPYKIDKTFRNGARWQLCWDLGNPHGLRVLNARFTPKGHGAVAVLRDLSLAQVHVPYDNGGEFSDLPLSDDAVPLKPADCPGGELRVHNRKAVVCATTLPRGYAYKKYDSDPDAAKDRQRQGQEIGIFSVFEIGWYNYVLDFRFSDDGDITPRLGATGSLAPQDEADPADAKYGWPVGPGDTKHATNHSHNAFWRVDFDLQGRAGDQVEQFDFEGDGTAKRVIKRSRPAKETSAKLSPLRFWRVVDPGVKNTDRHPISWQIGDVASTQYRGIHKFSRADVYVTQYDKCERLAFENDGACAKSVDTYLNGQTLTDPVVWVGVDFHHVPRDEDQDPMPTHWQGFTITPRDVTAQNPHVSQ